MNFKYLKFEWTEFILGVFKNVRNVNMTEEEPIITDDSDYLIEASKVSLVYFCCSIFSIQNLTCLFLKALFTAKK